MAQVVVHGLMTEYHKTGSGQAVVLLHGWGDSQETFAALAKELTETHQVYTLDLPGFGKTQAPPKAWGLTDYAEFVATFLSKVDIKPYAIIGHSNGGAIAIRGVGSGVLQADKLVLLAASGIRGEYKGRNAALRLVAKTGKVLTSPLPKRIKKRLRAGAYKTIGSDMLVAEHLQETFKKVVSDDVRADTSKISIPTLLIYGDKDQATPLRYAEQLETRLSHGKLLAVPGAGHFIHHDASQQVILAIQEFLK